VASNHCLLHRAADSVLQHASDQVSHVHCTDAATQLLLLQELSGFGRAEHKEALMLLMGSKVEQPNAPKQHENATVDASGTMAFAICSSQEVSGHHVPQVGV